MSATSRRLPLSYLFAALLVVAGLAMSAPPSCVCAPNEHFGLLLHPLFPHLHGAAHALGVWQEDATESQQATQAVEQAPGISAGTADTLAYDALSGVILPLFLAAALLEASRRIVLTERRPEQRASAPPSPPPRRSLVLA
jgi:hypothetical protein